MATDNVINGTLMLIKTDAASGGNASATAIAMTTSASISVNMETRDISQKGSQGWRDLLEAQKSWSASAEGVYAIKDASGSAVKGFTDLFTNLGNREQIYLELTTGVTGDKYYSGKAYVTSIEQTAPMEDNATFSVSFEGTGELSEATES